MGTSFMIKIRRAQGDILFDQAITELERLERKFSDYLPQSEIAQINRMAGKSYVPVSQESLRLIKEALKISEQTEGAFDPTVRPLMEIWGFKRQVDELPDKKEIGEVLNLIGWDKVMIESNRVMLKYQGMKLDLGGIAKGYAVDKVVTRLKNAGVKNAIVEVGGDLYCLGRGVNSEGWNIGIRNPKKYNTILIKIDISDSGIATSGNYENFFIRKGVRYSHIIDPRSGYPLQSSIMSITVISPECMLSDAWATALSVLGWQEAQRIVESNSELEAVLIKEVDKDVVVWISSGLKDKVEYYEN